MRVGTVSEIWRYPVKSMGGELLQEVRVEAGGLRGDRAWALRDEVRGGIRGAKKLPGLMHLRARYPKPPAEAGSSPAEIRFPDGSIRETGDPEINELLTRVMDHEVSLWPLLPADALEHYKRGAPTHDDLEEELRSIFGRTRDEPLPDLGLFPPELFEFESPPGTYFDAFPLLLLTDTSLQSMQEKASSSIFDVRRFRPNFLIADTEQREAFPELAWRGFQLKLGAATLRVTVECPRCVMVTHGFEDLPQDPSVMRALVRDAGGALGVYAMVETAGIVRVGDPIELVAR